MKIWSLEYWIWLWDGGTHMVLKEHWHYSTKEKAELVKAEKMKVPGMLEENYRIREVEVF